MSTVHSGFWARLVDSKGAKSDHVPTIMQAQTHVTLTDIRSGLLRPQRVVLTTARFLFIWGHMGTRHSHHEPPNSYRLQIRSAAVVDGGSITSALSARLSLLFKLLLSLAEHQPTASCHLAYHTWAQDTLAEWLRRWPSKPMWSPRVGSNPTGVAFMFVLRPHSQCKAWELTFFSMSTSET